MVLAKVDATAEEALAAKYDVRGFPTLKFYRDGAPLEYTGGRTEATMVSWLKKKTGPPAKVLDSAAAIKAFEKSASVVVVGFFDAAGGSDEQTAFNAAAFASEETPFGICSDAAVAAELGVEAPGVVLFKDFDEGKITYTGAYTKDDLSEFVNANALPLVVPFTQESAPKIFGGDIRSHMLLFLDPKDPQSEGIVEQATEAAKQKKGKALFVTVGPDDVRSRGS